MNFIPSYHWCHLTHHLTGYLSSCQSLLSLWPYNWGSCFLPFRDFCCYAKGPIAPPAVLPGQRNTYGYVPNFCSWRLHSCILQPNCKAQDYLLILPHLSTHPQPNTYMHSHKYCKQILVVFQFQVLVINFTKAKNKSY